jgi:hypothetical protein
MTKLSGVIKKVFNTESFGNFEKRIFWIEEIQEKYKNIFQLELWKKDVAMIDNYKVGDYVTVYIDIKGKHWQSGEKEGVMNSLKCWNIEKDGVLFKEINTTPE